MPRLKTPNLKLQTVADGNFELSSEVSERGTLICFYRGLHCPICATYLKELEQLTPQFEERGIKTIAVSTDDEERANKMTTRINAKNLRVGYGFSKAKRVIGDFIFQIHVAKLLLGLRSQNYLLNLVYS